VSPLVGLDFPASKVVLVDLFVVDRRVVAAPLAPVLALFHLGRSTFFELAQPLVKFLAFLVHFFHALYRLWPTS
jgi:hypothetical protein